MVTLASMLVNREGLTANNISPIPIIKIIVLIFPLNNLPESVAAAGFSRQCGKAKPETHPGRHKGNRPQKRGCSLFFLFRPFLRFQGQ